MYKKTVDQQTYLERVANHSTKGSKRGAVNVGVPDYPPEDYEREEIKKRKNSAGKTSSPPPPPKELLLQRYRSSEARRLELEQSIWGITGITRSQRDRYRRPEYIDAVKSGRVNMGASIRGKFLEWHHLGQKMNKQTQIINKHYPTKHKRKLLAGANTYSEIFERVCEATLPNDLLESIKKRTREIIENAELTK